MGILWTIILGFVIGVMANLLHPGKDNMGFIAVGQYMGWYQAGEGAGFIVSVVVSILLLVIFGKIRNSQSGNS